MHVNPWIAVKPECRVTMKEDGSRKILMCSANGNPSNITYKWTVDENEQNNNAKISQDGSVLEIEGNSETRMYNCTAENEVGTSEPCPIRVPGLYSKYKVLFHFKFWSTLHYVSTPFVVAIRMEYQNSAKLFVYI